LVVDDDPTQLCALHRALSISGYDCQTASDGAEAIARLAAEHFDVVVTDWFMPAATGVDVCRFARARAGRDYVYFIVTTSDGTKDRLIEAMNAGADDFLRKPIDLDELDARLIAAARVIGLQRALASRADAFRRTSEIAQLSARRDSLTAASNRLRLQEDLAALAARDATDRWGVVMIDIDRFKDLNDTQGHAAGDVALRRVADAMRGELRQSDALYRYGGEEFLALLPDVELAVAARVVERIRAAIEKLGILNPRAPSRVLTISAGVTALGPTERPESAIERADTAAYRAKARGRNRVEVAP
jgi:diguanylate cyclase (GGDEF)-like protein